MKTKTQKTTRASLLKEIAQKIKGAKPVVRSTFLHEIRNYNKTKLQRIARNVKVQHEQTLIGLRETKPIIRDMRVLDIGAADIPDKRATDAVDIQVSPSEIRRAKKKSKKLQNYYEGDFKHPPKEMKHQFDNVVAHFADKAMVGKSASKALDFVTKDNATAEIEAGIGKATEIVQTLHDADFKTLSIEAKEILAVAPALGDIAGTVVIKAHKKEGVKDTTISPITITLPHRYYRNWNDTVQSKKYSKKANQRRLTKKRQQKVAVPQLKGIRWGK
jgi:hypothetical protein